MRRFLTVALAVSVSALIGCEGPGSQSSLTSPAGPAAHVGSFGSTHMVDFEGTGITTGNSVEGLGTVHDHLNIQSTYISSAAVLIEEGTNPRAYTAGSTNNGCLADPTGTADGSSGAHGFSDTEATISGTRVPHSYEFTFADGVWANSFSVDLLDHGDFRQTGSGPLVTTLTGYDADDKVVDTDSHSTSAKEGRFDACASDGLQTLSVSGAGITHLTLTQSSETWDAGVGFDNLAFEPHRVTDQLDIKPGSDPNSLNLNSSGVIPVALLGTSSFDVSLVEVTTLAFDEDNAADPAHDLTDPAVLSDHMQDVNDDGETDLVTHWHTPAAIDGTQTEACLTGETTFGLAIEACDSVNIVG